MAQSKLKKFARQHRVGIRRTETAAATVAGGIVGSHAGAIGGALAGGHIGVAKGRRMGGNNFEGYKGAVGGMMLGHAGGAVAGAAGGYALAQHFHHSHEQHANQQRGIRPRNI